VDVAITVPDLVAKTDTRRKFPLCALLCVVIVLRVKIHGAVNMAAVVQELSAIMWQRRSPISDPKERMSAGQNLF
jgi:hypothetical protein